MEDILREQIRSGGIGGGHPSSYRSTDTLPQSRVPLVIGLTMRQVLDAADDAEIRAGVLDGVSTLQDSTEVLPLRSSRRAKLDRRANSLREAADDLRGIATQLMDEWTRPGRSS